MATVREARLAIEKHFLTEWSTTTQVANQNFNFDPPSTAKWIRFTILNAAGAMASFGASGERLYRRTGSLIVQIFTPIRDGLSSSDDLVQKVLNIFDGKQLSPSNVWFRNTTIQDVGPSNAFYQQNVSFEFIYHEVK